MTGTATTHFLVTGVFGDASCVASSFSRRVKTSRIDAFVFGIALDADGGGGTRFHSGEKGILHGVPLDLSIESRNGFAYGFNRVVRDA